VERDPELRAAIQQHNDLMDECERNPDPALMPLVKRTYIQTAPKPLIFFQCRKGYSQHQGLLRHFWPAHLNDRQCNSCDDGMVFLHQMYWQNHVAAVHRLYT
jgi:hypothetical protein